jgi:hypothetical protein
MNKSILQLLNLKPEHYEEMYLGSMLRWCESQSIEQADIQKLLANSALNAYYNIEYAKCEAEFLKLIIQYAKVKYITLYDRLKLYNDCTNEMFNRHSKPLVEMAKKMTINDTTGN